MHNKGYGHITHDPLDAFTFLVQVLPKPSVSTWLKLLFGAMLTPAGFATEAELAIGFRRHRTRINGRN